MPEPVAPPVAPPVTPASPAPALDEFSQQMLASINRVVTPDKTPPDPAKPAESGLPGVAFDPTKLGTRRNLGEIALAAAKAAATQVTPAPAAAPAAPATPKPPPAPVAPATVPAAKLVKKVDALAPVAAVAPPAPVAPAPPAPVVTADPDEAYIAGLPEELREEIKLAEYAETRFPEHKGKRAATIGFLKKVDEFTKSHQDLQLDSPEYLQFVEANKPRWTPAQKRKVEHSQIAEQVARETRESVMNELKPDLEATKRRLREQELAPEIARAATEFEDLLSTAPDGVQGIEMIPREVTTAIREKGYQAAVEEFPMEAPIAQATTHAAGEYLRLVKGLTQYNPQNPTHVWLANFIEEQASKWKARPESIQNGRRFLTPLEHNQMLATTPQNAGQFYTFSPDNVLNTLAINANGQYHSQLKAAEATLARKGKKAAAVPTIPAVVPPPVAAAPPAAAAPGAPPAAGSPRMRSAAAPGAGAVTEAPVSEEIAWVNRAYPRPAAAGA